MDALWFQILSHVQIEVGDEKVYAEEHDNIDLIDDLGYDSINLISLVVDIEREYDIEIADEYLLMDHLRKYSSLSKIIELKGGYIDNEQ